MARCSLHESARVGAEVPLRCKEQCGQFFDQACRESAGAYDYYDEDDCDASTEFSHDALQLSFLALKGRLDSPNRVYSIVDICMADEQEVGEASWLFHCPHDEA